MQDLSDKKTGDLLQWNKKREVAYRNEYGQTWSGRGKMPYWLEQEKRFGRDIEEFRVKPKPKRGRPVTGAKTAAERKAEQRLREKVRQLAEPSTWTEKTMIQIMADPNETRSRKEHAWKKYGELNGWSNPGKD